MYAHRPVDDFKPPILQTVHTWNRWQPFICFPGSIHGIPNVAMLTTCSNAWPATWATCLVKFFNSARPPNKAGMHYAQTFASPSHGNRKKCDPRHPNNRPMSLESGTSMIHSCHVVGHPSICNLDHRFHQFQQFTKVQCCWHGQGLEWRWIGPKTSNR